MENVRVERGQQDAQRMEDENGRAQGGLQLPAHRMEDENVRVERGQQDAQGMEDENGGWMEDSILLPTGWMVTWLVE